MLCTPSPRWVVSKPLCSVGWLTSVFYLQVRVWKRSEASWAKDPFPPLLSMGSTCLPFPFFPGSVTGPRGRQSLYCFTQMGKLRLKERKKKP